MNQKKIPKKIYELFKDLKNSNFRKSNNITFAEGKNIFSSALKNNIDIKYLIIDNKEKKDFENIINNYTGKINFEIFYVDEELLSRLSSTKTPYSSIIVFEIPKIIYDVKDYGDSLFRKNILNQLVQYITQNKFINCFYKISDPGNLGTIIRTNIGVGNDEILFIGEHCDIFSPKVIRSSAGSIFKLKKIYNIDETYLNEFFCILKERKIKIILAEKDSKYIEDINIKDFLPAIIIFGNEGWGFTEEIRKLKDFSISIFQTEDIESYNLSISHAIVNYVLKRLK